MSTRISRLIAKPPFYSVRCRYSRTQRIRTCVLYAVPPDLPATELLRRASHRRTFTLHRSLCLSKRDDKSTRVADIVDFWKNIHQYTGIIPTTTTTTTMILPLLPFITNSYLLAVRYAVFIPLRLYFRPFIFTFSCAPSVVRTYLRRTMPTRVSRCDFETNVHGTRRVFYGNTSGFPSYATNQTREIIVEHEYTFCDFYKFVLMEVQIDENHSTSGLVNT